MNKKQFDYIGNARIISALSELPKIGEQHELYNARVFSINAYENEKQPDFIFYRVYFGEQFTRENIKYFDIEIDTFYFSYAIEKKNIFKGALNNGRN